MFFRKVYHLAHLRLDKLCSALEIPDEAKRKIWTTFEHALREETSLMKDRHLDQIIMCSLYIVCRVRHTLNCRLSCALYIHQILNFPPRAILLYLGAATSHLSKGGLEG